VRLLVGLLLLIAFVVVPAWLTWEMGKQVGRRWYVVFGLLLSWLGTFLVVLLRQRQRSESRRVEHASEPEDLERGEH